MGSTFESLDKHGHRHHRHGFYGIFFPHNQVLLILSIWNKANWVCFKFRLSWSFYDFTRSKCRPCCDPSAGTLPWWKTLTEVLLNLILPRLPARGRSRCGWNNHMCGRTAGMCRSRMSSIRKRWRPIELRYLWHRNGNGTLSRKCLFGSENRKEVTTEGGLDIISTWNAKGCGKGLHRCRYSHICLLIRMKSNWKLWDWISWVELHRKFQGAWYDELNEQPSLRLWGMEWNLEYL